METKDFLVLLIFLILLIPFGLLWHRIFKYLRKYIITLLNYSVLVLFTLIGITAYFMLTFFISISLFNGKLSDLVAATSYTIVLFSNLLIIPALLLTIILTITYFVNRHKKRHR
ncbi:MAG: hypothetical protein JWO09_1588 [Bacteroidetes bacterium]|nr:hypothetical protein [Bacteroidota bacterium]